MYVLELYLRSKETLETENIKYLYNYLKNKGYEKSVDSILTNDLWKIGRLDIDRHWHAMHYLLTKNSLSWEKCNLPFVVTKEENHNHLLINGVMGGTSIKETIGFMDFAPVRYLTQSETKRISEALLQISKEEFESRYEAACKFNPDVYKALWDSDPSDLEDYWYWFRCISQYYKIAAQRGRGMLLYLGCFYGVDFEWEDISIE